MLMAACKPGTPSQYIQPDDMEDILVDYYMAKALAQQEGITSQGNQEYRVALYTEAVLRKHGVTQAEFDSSLVYYFTRADRFDEVLQQVSTRLDEQAMAMGASEGEIGKYTAFNATGDTANIWADRTTALLLPYPPYNRWDFSIEADSSYRKGDALLLMFMSDYMYQQGNKDGMVYLAVEYEDTVVSRNLHFAVAGLSQLRVSEDTARTIKKIKGFFYLNGGFEPTTATRMLFLNNVQLIRFHTKHEEIPTDSIPRDSIGGSLPTDSVGGRDSTGRGDELLPPDRRDSTYRVAARRDSATTR
jgi:hypothetical protein